MTTSTNDSLSSATLDFTSAEYLSRLERVRNAMHQEKLDVLLVQSTPNVAYLTGYEPAQGNTDVCVVVPLVGGVQVIVADEVRSLIPHHDWIAEIVGLSGVDRRTRSAQTVQHLEAICGVGRIGVEKGRYPLGAGFFIRLIAATPSATLVDASQLVLDIRLVKSSAEIEMMRIAASYSGIGMRAAAAALRNGYTDNDVGSAAYGAMLAAGSEAPYPAPFIMVGERTGWGPHLTWKRFSLQSGAVVNLEMTGIHCRYAAPLYRTATVGPPDELVRKVCDADLAAVAAVLETAKPYISAHDLAHKATKRLDPIRDLVYCTGQVGYGVGLTLSPNWVEHSFRIIEGNHRPIVPGMAFHSPIAVRLPGRFAVAFSETWVMTESGPEVLTDMTRELLIGEL